MEWLGTSSVTQLTNSARTRLGSASILYKSYSSLEPCTLLASHYQTLCLLEFCSTCTPTGVVYVHLGLHYLLRRIYFLPSRWDGASSARQWDSLSLQVAIKHCTCIVIHIKPLAVYVRKCGILVCEILDCCCLRQCPG